MRRGIRSDHTMRPAHWLALFALWQLSVLAAAGLAWQLARDERADAQPLTLSLGEMIPFQSGVSGGEAELPEAWTRALHSLQGDNADLHRRVDRLSRAHDALSRDYLKLSFRNVLDNALDNAPAARRVDGGALWPAVGEAARSRRRCPCRCGAGGGGRRNFAGRRERQP